MPRPVLLTAVVFTAYLAVTFGFAPGNSVTGFPVHHDDFRNLSWIAPTLPEPARPVSGYLLTLLSALGIPAYYAALHALTAAYAASVLLSLRALFEIRTMPALLAFAAAAAMLSIEYMVEFSKYTGLITSLLSGTAGAAAIVVLLAERSRATPRPLALVGAIALAAISGFSKEDFLLPILVAAVLAAWERRTERRWLAAPAGVFVLAVAVFAYNRSVSAVYTSGAGQFYRQDFGPASIATVAWHYVTLTRGTMISAALQCAAPVLNAVARNRIAWPRLLASQAIVAALAFPYLCLPNHTAPYYVFHWTPWQCGVFALVLWRLWPNRAGVALVSIVAAVCIWATQPMRGGIVQWYRSAQTLNRRMVGTLESHRAFLAPYDRAAVEGAPMLSPWFATSGEFLLNRYGFRQQWLIRAPRDGEFLREFRARAGGSRMGRNTVVAIEEELPPGVPTVRLAEDGSGIAVPPR